MPTNLNWLVAGLSAYLFAQALRVAVFAALMAIDFYLGEEEDTEEPMFLIVEAQDECKDLN